MSQVQTHFAANLRRLVANSSCTEQQVADALQMSRHKMLALMHGICVPDLVDLLRISQQFSFSLDELVHKELRYPEKEANA